MTLSRVLDARRVDLVRVMEMVTPGSRVLDVGCGDGELLRLLAEERAVDGRGIELSQQGVNDCVSKGLSVVQGDADADLADYPDAAFDFVILSQTLQATRQPRVVLENMLRIGRRAIVSVPNFGHWSVRLQLAFRGRMPVTEKLSHSWYDTPNIHFCTITDFIALAGELGAVIDTSVVLDQRGRVLSPLWPRWTWNLVGEQAIFLLHGRILERARESLVLAPARASAAAFVEAGAPGFKLVLANAFAPPLTMGRAAANPAGSSRL